ncbi:major facilitator superfamily-domain-containing protein [Coemansia spiralis]|nr:major facilitator superfamily-domain-containing protein [Coemansia spiralis]
MHRVETTASLAGTLTDQGIEIAQPEPVYGKVEEKAEEGQSRQLLYGMKLAMAIISLDLLIFLSALDASIVATAYVPIGNELGALDKAEWIVTSYLITMTAFQPLYGRISDLLGRVETIVFAIVVFLAGSILCAVSKSMTMLIVSRAVQGIGGAGLASLALIVIADIMNERQRGKYVGIFSGTYGVASSIAPVVGGAIVQKSKWPIIFWINIPICVAALVLIVLLLRIPRPRGAVKEKLLRIDFAGALLCLCGVVVLLLSLAWGGREYAWSSSQVICTLVFGVLILVLFVLFEWRLAKVPIVPMHMFKVRNVVFSSLCNLLFGFAINGTVIFIPQWALIVKNATNVTSGAYLVPYCVGMILTSIVSGFLVNKLGRCREIIIVGAAILLVGNCLLLLLGSDGSLGKVIGFMLLSGLGVGTCIQTLNLIGQASVSGRDMATSTTTFMFFRSLGQVLAVSVLSSVIQNTMQARVEALTKTFSAYAQSILDATKDQALLYKSGLPAELIQTYIKDYSDAMHMAFVVLSAFTGVYFVSTLGFKHVELQKVLKKTIDS